ncbi:MAG: hypothetical protein WC481_01405 [Candidatus Omnitrophota bacterium]
MNYIDQDIAYGINDNDGTGSHDDQIDYRVVSYPFDRYEIKIKISKNNEFLGIEEVGINKEFMSYRQKLSVKGVHDIDEFYK